MTKTIRIAAALIDDGEGRVFLVRKRGTAAFMQPGGKIDPGETAFQALARELTEELRFTPTEAEARYVFDAIKHAKPLRIDRSLGFLIEFVQVGVDEASTLLQEFEVEIRNHGLPLHRSCRLTPNGQHCV